MKWIKKGTYYLETTGYTIAKTGKDEATRYTLFHGNDRIDTFLTADEAKQRHEVLNK